MTIDTLPRYHLWDWRFTCADPDALVDDAVPTPAFVWNAWLGVGLHRRVDLTAAEPLMPVQLWAFAHREYLERVIGELAACGIRQFVDLGCGAPSAGHAAECIVRRVPDARVVCVDLDPVAVKLMEHRYRDDPRVHAVEGNVRRLERLLRDEQLLAVDLGEPVAWLAIAVLQHLTDADADADADADDPARSRAQLRAACVPGSYLAVSHPAPAPDAPAGVAAGLAGYPAPWVARDAAAAGALLAGWTPVEPGVVPLTASNPHAAPIPVPPWAVLAQAAPMSVPTIP